MHNQLDIINYTNCTIKLGWLNTLNSQSSKDSKTAQIAQFILINKVDQMPIC